MGTEKSAVQWVINELRQMALSKVHHLSMGDIILTQGHIDEIEEKAKKIEEDQHGDTWDNAIDTYEKRGHVYVRAWEDFDEYYYKKYKSE